MPATPEQRSLVDDPATTAAILHELAAAEPELWPAIAVHSNVYPDLLAWMRGNGLAEPRADAAPSLAAEASPNADDSAPAAPRRLVLSPKTIRILIGSAAGLVAALLAVILIVTLVVVPQQRAAEVLAAAIDDFDDAAAACEEQTSSYTEALDAANAQTATDPATLADPETLTALAEAIAEHEGAETCTPPAMADDSAAIDEQRQAMTAATGDLSGVVAQLVAATDAVSLSARAKLEAEAAAAAAAQQAAEQAARAAATWHYTSDDGFTFDIFFDVGAPTTSGPGGSRLADTCSAFDPATMIAVPVEVTGTATTQNFGTPMTIYVDFSTYGRYAGPNSNMSGYLDSDVELWFNDGSTCLTPNGNLGIFREEPMAAGQTMTLTVYVLLEKWKTPNTPNGDVALLDWITIGPPPMNLNNGRQWRTDSSKVITLNNQVVGG